MSDLPTCHRCGSPCEDTNEDEDFYFWRCGSSSGQESDACEYVKKLRDELDRMRAVVKAAIDWESEAFLQYRNGEAVSVDVDAELRSAVIDYLGEAQGE